MKINILLLLLLVPTTTAYLIPQPDPSINVTYTKYWMAAGAQQQLIIETPYSLQKIVFTPKDSITNVFFNVTLLNYNTKTTDPAGIVHSYYILESNINLTHIEKTTYLFALNKTWAENKSVYVPSIHFEAYDTTWTALETTQTDKGDIIQIYAETKKPSLIAVVGTYEEKISQNITDEIIEERIEVVPFITEENVSTNTTQEITPPPKKKSLLWYFIGGGILLLLVVAYFIFFKRTKN